MSKKQNAFAELAGFLKDEVVWFFEDIGYAVEDRITRPLRYKWNSAVYDIKEKAREARWEINDFGWRLRDRSKFDDLKDRLADHFDRSVTKPIKLSEGVYLIRPEPKEKPTEAELLREQFKAALHEAVDAEFEVIPPAPNAPQPA